MACRRILLFTCAYLGLAVGQNNFANQLFPQQQQQLKLLQSNIQSQLQQLQQQWHFAEGVDLQTSLQNQQSDLLRRLQETQVQQQELQNRLHFSLLNNLQPQQHPNPHRRRRPSHKHRPQFQQEQIPIDFPEDQPEPEVQIVFEQTPQVQQQIPVFPERPQFQPEPPQRQPEPQFQPQPPQLEPVPQLQPQPPQQQPEPQFQPEPPQIQPEPQLQPQPPQQQPEPQLQPQPPQQQPEPQPPQREPEPQLQARQPEVIVEQPNEQVPRLEVILQDGVADIFVQQVIASPPCATNSGEAGFCRPLVKCITFYTELPELRKQPCRLFGNEFGVCCPARKQRPADQNRLNTGVLHAPPPPRVVIPPFTPQQLNHAAAAALERIQERFAFVASLFQQKVIVQVGTPAAWHQEFFASTNTTLEQGDVAQKNVEASVSLINEFHLSPDQGTFALPSFSVLNTVIADTCPQADSCRVEKYRSVDGSCNNLANARWGRVNNALQRILPPKYGDGVNAPRSQGADGQELTSARVISTQFTTEVDQPDESYTLLLMQWGQFLDHDLTHTPISRGQSGSGLSCCRDGKIIDQVIRHPDCFPISLPLNDHIFAPFAERCMEFVRSLPAPRPECNFGPREQMNQVTGYIDGSNIYGSSASTQKELREGRGGRLRVQTVRGRSLLPGNRGECQDRTQTMTCFKAGDSRANEQVDLAVMHTVWMREHNRVAQELERINPSWSDEGVFQEARRVVVAEMQHITYNEFLPLILGRLYMDKFELTPKESGFSKLYDDTLNGGITNVFATAAFRFGHSLIQSTMKGYSRFGNVRENLVLHQHHFSPFVLYKDGAFDDLIRGLATQTCQRFDRFFTKELTDHLFQGNLDFGLDLVALNIQRGRDHGIPPYNDWREVCGLPRATSWESLLDVMDQQSVATLRTLYSSVNEIDLFVAGVAERPIPGALVGQTFVCLIGDQFARLKRGDRFFYEEANQTSSFHQTQLDEIRKVSLARILCDNSDDIAVMQPLSFLQASYANQRVGCASESIPRMDLKAWSREIPAA